MWELIQRPFLASRILLRCPVVQAVLGLNCPEIHVCGGMEGAVLVEALAKEVRRLTFHYVTFLDFTFCFAAICYIVLCYVLRYVLFRYLKFRFVTRAMLRYVTLRLLRYAMLGFISLRPRSVTKRFAMLRYVSLCSTVPSRLRSVGHAIRCGAVLRSAVCAFLPRG